MEIYIRQKCADCHGVGQIRHPLWRKFYEQHPDPVTNEDVRQWFEGHPHPLPDEQIPCSSCNPKGAMRQPGYIEEWVSVKELLELLLGHVR